MEKLNLKKRLRIGLIVDQITVEATGIGKYCEGFIDNLLYYDKKNEYLFITNKPLIRKYSSLNHRVIFIPNKFPFLKNFFWINLLPILIKRHYLDYIINFSMFSHYIPFKQKEILIVYDLTIKRFPQFHQFRHFLYYSLFFKRTLFNAYMIITPSLATKKDLKLFFPKEIQGKKIISLFFPIMKNKGIKRPEFLNFRTPYILNINTLEPRKNLINLIKAFNKLKEKDKISHKLIIVGKKGWKYEEIFNEWRKSKFKKDIIFTDYIREEEKNYLLQHTDIFVYPSIYEGFGIPILEAMRYGRPIICGKNSSLNEVIGSAGLKIDTRYYINLYKAIKKLLFNQKLKKKLSNKAKIRSKIFFDKKKLEYKIKFFLKQLI